MSFLRNKYARILTLVLLLQASVYYAVASRHELTVPVAPLATFPLASNGWRTVRETPLEREVLEVLKADDTLNREYVDPSGSRVVNFLMEYFKTQRYGQSPHSPKNCLPGSGWEPLETESLKVVVPGRAEPIETNKYLVARGSEKSVVLYWYQSRNRIIANEYRARFWLVMDAIRYRRSDTSMLRIVVPVQDNNTTEALDTGVEFIRAVFPDIMKHLPS